jgi:hypothetical protein
MSRLHMCTMPNELRSRDVLTGATAAAAATALPRGLRRRGPSAKVALMEANFTLVFWITMGWRFEEMHLPLLYPRRV